MLGLTCTAISRDVIEKYILFSVSSFRACQMLYNSQLWWMFLNPKKWKGSVGVQQLSSVRTEPTGSLQIRSQSSAAREVRICWWAEVERSIIPWSTSAQTAELTAAQMQSWGNAAVLLWVTESWTWLNKECLTEVPSTDSGMHVGYKQQFSILSCTAALQSVLCFTDCLRICLSSGLETPLGRTKSK